MSNYYEIKKKQGVLEAYSLPDLIAGIKECFSQGIELGDPNSTVKAGNFYSVPLSVKEEYEGGEKYLTRTALEKEISAFNSKNKVEQFARTAYKIDLDRNLPLDEMKLALLEEVFPSPRKPFTDMVTVGEKVDWFTEEEKDKFDEWAQEECGIKLDGRKKFENMKEQFWTEYNLKITEKDSEEITTEENQESK